MEDEKEKKMSDDDILDILTETANYYIDHLDGKTDSQSLNFNEIINIKLKEKGFTEKDFRNNINDSLRNRLFKI